MEVGKNIDIDIDIDIDMEVGKGKVHQKSKRKTKMFYKGVDGCPPQTNFLSLINKPFSRGFEEKL